MDDFLINRIQLIATQLILMDEMVKTCKNTLLVIIGFLYSNQEITSK